MPNYNNLTVEELAGLFSEGDEAAFKQIYDRFCIRMYRTAMQKVNSKEVAEELVQDLFANFWLKRDIIKINTNLEAYLSVSMRNLVISHIRASLSKEKYVSDENIKYYLAENNIENGMDETDLNLALEEAVGRLPEKAREVFYLSRFENQSTFEIADKLNISNKTVEYHITKALKFLRVHLKDFVTVVGIAFTSSI